MLKTNDQIETAAGDNAAHHAAPDVKAGPIKTLIRGSLQVIIVVAILAGAKIGMDRIVATAPERPSRPSFTVAIPVSAEPVTFSDHRPSIRLFGEIVAGRQVDLRPALSGEIIEIHPALAAGARVEAGDVLVRFDDFDARGAVTEARANLAQTEAAIIESNARAASETEQLEAARRQLDLAQSDLERARELRATGAITEKQIEDRELIVSQRAATVRQREANLAIEEARALQNEATRERLAWKLAQAENALTDVELIAPFDGIVRNANAEVGKRAGSGDVLATLYSDTDLEVRFTLTNAQYGRLVTDVDPIIGRMVRIGWDVGGTVYSYDAEITRLGAEISSNRGGVEVFASVRADDVSAGLRPGAFVSVVVPDRIYPQSIRLPETAVYSSGDVHVIDAEGALEARPVTVAALDDGEAIITDGLQSGEVVLTTRMTEIDSSMRVRVVGGEADGHGAPRPERGQGNRSGNADRSGEQG